MKNEMTLDIVTGKNSKDPSKEWTALKIQIGEWSKLVFVGSDRPLITSNFEMEYIKKIIEENK